MASTLVDFGEQDPSVNEYKKVVNKVGIFGDADLNDIPDDPDAITSGWYHAEARTAKFINKDGNLALAINFYIEDPASDFDGRKVDLYCPYPDLSEKNYNDCDAKEKQSLSRLKKYLTRGFGLTSSDLATFGADVEGDKEKIEDNRVYIRVVSNNKSGTTYNNIYDVVRKDLYEESHGANDTSADSLSAGF